MIAFMLAIAVTASATAGAQGHGARAADGRPCALSGTCVNMRSEGDDIRLSRSLPPGEDRKMDAYNMSPSRQCGLIGGQRCPGKGRQIWRLGEPVRHTIARSFGLN
ncbi:MAG: hypothetical protein ACO1NM_07750 [Sphingobium phenoxybenzoativorans]|uniref:hypothetical protein n=1 Tax=Sphingobium phenoxybenzoativorans TaxID=1592790 RepID=UPI001112D412|nr:hypothetical protein [Sphingobium phenoxybenzoativorans]